MATDTKLMTADELLAMPERGPCGERYELIDGELVAMSPAGERHCLIQQFLSDEISPFVRQRRLGVCYGSDLGIVFGRAPDTVLAPDLSFIRQERRQPVRVGFCEVIPDLVVEVMSPSERFARLEEKAAGYVASGVAEVWVVHPDRQVVYVHAPGTDRRELRPGDTLASDLLPGFSLPVADIFAVLDEL